MYISVLSLWKEFLIPPFWMFVLLFSYAVVSGQNVRITAPAQFILNIDQIQIDCQPEGSLYSQILALSLLKNNQPMVSVGNLNGKTSVIWSDSAIQSRATTNSPNFDTVSTAQLRVTISASNTQCDDEAVYTCKVSGLDSSFNPVPNNEVSKNVSVVVKPDRMNEMQISPLPSAKGQYSEKENIALSCTGTVGAYNDPPRITWCINRFADVSLSDLESDSQFRSISQSDAQVVGSGSTRSCQYQRTSIVIYQVANTDTNTTFWCQITAPGDSPICGQGTVRRQKSIEVVPSAPVVSPDGSSDSDVTNNGLLIATVIGWVTSLILAVILVSVIIAFVIYRRKHQRTKDTGNNQVGRDNKPYDNLDNRIPMSEVSPYQTIINAENISSQDTNNLTYEKLDDTQINPTPTTYQTLMNAQKQIVEKTDGDYINPVVKDEKKIIRKQ